MLKPRGTFPFAAWPEWLLALVLGYSYLLFTEGNVGPSAFFFAPGQEYLMLNRSPLGHIVNFCVSRLHHFRTWALFSIRELLSLLPFV